MPITEEQKRKALQEYGYDPDKYILEDLPEKVKPEGRLKAASRELLEGGAPALTSLLAGAGGAALTTAGVLGAGASLPVTVPLALGLAGGYGMHKLQEKLKEKF